MANFIKTLFLIPLIVILTACSQYKDDLSVYNETTHKNFGKEYSELIYKLTEEHDGNYFWIYLSKETKLTENAIKFWSGIKLPTEYEAKQEDIRNTLDIILSNFQVLALAKNMPNPDLSKAVETGKLITEYNEDYKALLEDIYPNHEVLSDW